MNEKIKELAEQATKHYPATESSGEFWTFDKEKFAELIVREVFAKIEDERFKIYQPVKESVMKHFGVKE